METKMISHFYVINWDFNHDNIEYYDVMPWLINCWKERFGTKYKRTKAPKTIEELKEFVMNESQYMFWSKCEYEVIVTGWPQQNNKVKIDVHDQIMNNIDVVVRLLADYVGIS